LIEISQPSAGETDRLIAAELRDKCPHDIRCRALPSPPHIPSHRKRNEGVRCKGTIVEIPESIVAERQRPIAMKILVIGSGGREHALVWKLRQSARTEKVFCAPGNAGIGEMAELVPIGVEQIGKLGDFAEQEQIDLTVVGPELALTLGIVDLFEKKRLTIFGPSREAARLEGSKALAKELMEENHIPTAAFATFSDPTAAKRYVARKQPCVVKADGLAAGKGVVICSSRDEAEAAIDAIMVRRAFGAAGDRVVIEEFLSGEEASFMALTDGEHVLPLATSQDHKRVFDADRGPNTGGMGAYSPAPVVNSEVQRDVVEMILKPLLAGLKRKGICYRGLLYVGLMITDDGPKVLEFNARFGDPECQPVMMRLFPRDWRSWQ